MKINDTDFEHAAEFETRVREVISKLRVLLDDIGDKNEDKVVASVALFGTAIRLLYQMGCSKESAEQRLASTLDLVWLTSELVEEVGDTTTVH
jgi:hypothetical protein|tara:strand:- start:703 stop:981 length:279 start_codon:yes stop_codon:yes gene_type:complete